MMSTIKEKYDELLKQTIFAQCKIDEHEQQHHEEWDNYLKAKSELDREKIDICKKLFKAGNRFSETEIKNDPIFLLSQNEYIKYKDKIPGYAKNNWYGWWLRTAVIDSSATVFTLTVPPESNNAKPEKLGYTNEHGVRPAIRTNSNKTLLLHDRECIIKHGITWIKLDEDLYIAEHPIFFSSFNNTKKITSNYGVNNLMSSFYSQSLIRSKLLQWYEERKDW